MKHRSTLLTTLLVLAGLSLQAQSISIEKVQQPIKQKGFYPKLSPSGTLMTFTSEAYGGLSLYRFSDNSVEQVSTDKGSGFDPVFSTNEKKLFYKQINYESRLRKEGVKSYDLEKKTELEMLRPRRNVRQLQAYKDGVITHAESKLFRSSTSKSKEAISNYVWSDGNNLNVFRNNKTTAINPIKGARGYIWTSLSPNAKMILFHAAGKGSYVCDWEGRIIAELGDLNAPVWYGNDFVVGMQDKDDGHFVTESKILMKSLDGKVEKVLSPAGEIAMYPAASGKASKVAYNTLAGDIYVLDIRITK